MTPDEIDAALSDAEAIVMRLAELTPAFTALQKSMDNGEFTEEQLSRWKRLDAFVDDLLRSLE